MIFYQSKTPYRWCFIHSCSIFHTEGGPDGNGEAVVYTLENLNEDISVPLLLNDAGKPPMNATQILHIRVGQATKALKSSEANLYVLKSQVREKYKEKICV